MTRSRASARQAGTSFERLIADTLAHALHDDRIDRRVKNGATDKGDIAALRVHNQRVVVECKNYAGRVQPSTWLGEAEIERIHDSALAALVIAKRRGKSAGLDQIVMLTVRDLAAIITGERP